MTLEVPGALKESVEVTPGPAAGTLVVKAHAPQKETNALLRAERGVRSGTVHYQRILPVAYDADCTNVKASLAEGVLTLTVPKTRARIDEKA